MSHDQLHDEKLSVQKTLLQFESTFGRPVSISCMALDVQATLSNESKTRKRRSVIKTGGGQTTLCRPHGTCVWGAHKTKSTFIE